MSETRGLKARTVTELQERLTYDGYLGLDLLLSAQRPLSSPPHHDEMVFIIQHQVAELWFRLMLHELEATCRWLREDQLPPAIKGLARVKQIQLQLISQWSVLDSLTPSEYAQFRDVLGQASGFQSFQFRKIQFILGNKDPAVLSVFDHAPQQREALARVLEAPDLYDEFVRYLARQGHEIPEARRERDWAQPAESHPQLVEVFRRIYEHPRSNWDSYEMCEKLVDTEMNFQMWRFRHIRAVERIIGRKPGTGGTSGVAFLRDNMEVRLFPELLEVRTVIGS